LVKFQVHGASGGIASLMPDLVRSIVHDGGFRTVSRRFTKMRARTLGWRSLNRGGCQTGAFMGTDSPLSS
jgi:hypothetical protein